jgi:hypothetical protein
LVLSKLGQKGALQGGAVLVSDQGIDVVADAFVV